MPFTFQLPTTSNSSLASCLSSGTHPSLPQTAAIKRNTVRSVLKKYKRLSPHERLPSLTAVQSTIQDYLPYLLVVDAGLAGQSVSGESVDITLRKELTAQWRSTLSSTTSGREIRRIKGKGLDYELDFVLTTLAYTHVASARSSLLLLYGSFTPSVEQRMKIIQNATRSLLSAASVHTYLATRTLETDASQATVETLSQTQLGLSALALAEATLLAVLKDDPHPFVVTQMRNKNDKEWMIKAPEIPKVRAHLFARLCLAAADHAATAEAGLSASGKVSQDLLDYVRDLRRTARAKALRLHGVAAEMEGETGTAIAWLRGAKKALGYAVDEGDGASAMSGLKKLKKDWTERREDKKVEKGGDWGSDAGRLEELRVIEYLEARWTKMNDTINTQLIPPSDPLVANMPSGRDVHAIPHFEKPMLDEQALRQMRAPPEKVAIEDDAQDLDSSDEEAQARDTAGLPGGFPAGSSQSTQPYY